MERNQENKEPKKNGSSFDLGLKPCYETRTMTRELLNTLPDRNRTHIKYC